jgi:3-deoxy-D-manno-octulosonic-acid transferase
LWPNLFAELERRGVPLLIANARLSRRSLKGYRPIAPLVRHAVATVDVVAAQSEGDAQRYRRLGARADAVRVTGNLKYDQELASNLEGQGQAWRDLWGRSRPVWIAASTHPDEEDAVIRAHQSVLARRPEALLLWAPRHPERFCAVVLAAQRSGLRVQARREQGLPDAQAQVFVVDTLGELMAFYAAADVAFVGGSLQEVGGHNLLEPAALGVPALVGPHTYNFQDIAALLLEAGAVRRIADANGLAAGVLHWFDDPADRLRCGESGRTRMAAERGALARTLALVEACLARRG